MQLRLLSLTVIFVASQLCAGLYTPDQLRLDLYKPTFSQVKHALKKASIIKDVIDEFTPECFVTVSYNKTPVSLGNYIKPKATQEKPDLKVYCPHVKETKGMTIVLTDPDAPMRSDAKWGEFCHWIAAVEALHSERDDGVVIDGDDIIDYKPPSPPEKTGPHRYVFLLLEGDNTNLTAPEGRKRWGHEEKGHGVRDWAEREELKVVGANFFYARNKKQ